MCANLFFCPKPLEQPIVQSKKKDPAQPSVFCPIEEHRSLVQKMAEEVLWWRPYVLVINEKVGSIRVERWQRKKIPVIPCFAAGHDGCPCGKSPAPQHQQFQRAGREENLTCALTRFYLKVK
jgi:hypothetical protein